MKNYQITKNPAFNSFEITFTEIPPENVRAALKALRFRWHNSRGIWYGYAKDAETVAEAIENASTDDATPAKAEKFSSVKAIAPLWERTRTDALPAYGTENELKKAVEDKARAAGCAYDKAVAAYIRQHLRERFPECRFSVTSGGAGYLMNCDIIIKSSPYAREHIKGNPNACTLCERYDHDIDGPELAAVLAYCQKLFNAFDADDGDDYADYGARHDLYGGARVAHDYTQTAPTKAQIAVIAAYRASLAEYNAEEERRAAIAYEEQRKKDEAARIRAEEENKRRAKLAADIEAGAVVVNVAEADRVIISGLRGGYGKECNINELRETMSADNYEMTPQRAEIARRVYLTPELFKNFTDMFLYDFSFLQGMGGTASEDKRLENVAEVWQLNDEQCKACEWYICKAVAIYCDEDLKLIIDPEGYNYARYVYIAPAGAENDTETMREYIEAETEKAAGIKPFYFPAPLAEQIENAKPESGELVTLLSVDPWTMQTRATRGELVSLTPCEYAQYKNAARVTIRDGKKDFSSIIRPGADALLYRGIVPDAPEVMRKRKIETGSGCAMWEDLTGGAHAHEYIKECAKLYTFAGYTAIIDTIQR